MESALFMIKKISNSQLLMYTLDIHQHYCFLLLNFQELFLKIILYNFLKIILLNYTSSISILFSAPNNIKQT